MMSMDPSSPVVCEIPDCATTQAEIEAELKTFLTGFCSICKRDRAGKLCGCAFPCSLTFRATMMTKIHELLGINKPFQRRQIQVCFKHPDLLKQAREACVANREGSRRSSGSFTGGYVGTNSSGPKVRAKRGRPKKAISSPYSLAARTSKQSDVEDGSHKMTKIQFGSTLNVGDQTIVVGGDGSLPGEEEADDTMEEDLQEIDGNEQRVDLGAREDLASSNKNDREVKRGKLKLNIGRASNEDAGDANADSDSEVEGHESSDKENGYHRKKAFQNDFDPPDESEVDSFDEEEEASDTDFLAVPEPKAITSVIPKVLRIQYENYGEAILQPEMGQLVGQSFLNDVSFVCKNGTVPANSLLLGSMSPFLREILKEVPLVDRYKVVIMPDIHAASMDLFLGLLFNDKYVKRIDRVKMMRVKQVARLLQINTLLSKWQPLTTPTPETALTSRGSKRSPKKINKPLIDTEEPRKKIKKSLPTSAISVEPTSETVDVKLTPRAVEPESSLVSVLEDNRSPKSEKTFQIARSAPASLEPVTSPPNPKSDMSDASAIHPRRLTPARKSAKPSPASKAIKVGLEPSAMQTTQSAKLSDSVTESSGAAKVTRTRKRSRAKAEDTACSPSTSKVVQETPQMVGGKAFASTKKIKGNESDAIEVVVLDDDDDDDDDNEPLSSSKKPRRRQSKKNELVLGEEVDYMVPLVELGSKGTTRSVEKVNNSSRDMIDQAVEETEGKLTKTFAGKFSDIREEKNNRLDVENSAQKNSSKHSRKAGPAQEPLPEKEESVEHQTTKSIGSFSKEMLKKFDIRADCRVKLERLDSSNVDKFLQPGLFISKYASSEIRKSNDYPQK